MILGLLGALDERATRCTCTLIHNCTRACLDVLRGNPTLLGFLFVDLVIMCVPLQGVRTCVIIPACSLHFSSLMRGCAYARKKNTTTRNDT